MARDPNPDHPGEEGVWFTVRKDGKYVNLPTLSDGFPTDDPTVGWIPLSAFQNILGSSAMKPSASVFIGLANKFTSTKYNLYKDKHASIPVKNTDTVDLVSYGLKKNNGIVLEVGGDNSDKDSDDGDKDGDKDSNDGDKDGDGSDKGSDDGDKDGNNSDKGSDDGDKDKDSGKDNNDDDKDGKDGDGKDGKDGDGNDSDSGDAGREYHPDFPGKIGYWFVVQDENGNNIDVSSGATAVDKNDSSLGWNPLPKDPDLPSDIWHAGAGLVKRKICQSLDLDPRDYQVYVSQSDKASDFIGDNYVIDFETVGLRGNNPMLVKYYIVKNSDGGSDEDNGQDNNSGGNEDSNDSGNNDGNSTENTDPYINFTKRLENITTGNWDIYYPDAIPGTYNGEILWTDGNPSYSFATAPTIQAYKVVRRDPCVYNGRVIQTGLASASTYYFKLLD